MRCRPSCDWYGSVLSVPIVHLKPVIGSTPTPASVGSPVTPDQSPAHSSARSEPCGNVVHIEKGRNRADERFWSKADEACNAGGALLAAFHELEATKTEHDHAVRLRELDEARARAMRFRQ